MDYMPKTDREALRDPIPIYRDRLLKEGVLTEARATEIENKAKAEIDDAMKFARESPYPQPEAAMEGVFA